VWRHRDRGCSAVALTSQPPTEIHRRLLAETRTLDHHAVGLGNRAGNAPLEEVAVALALGYEVDAGIRLERLTALSRRFEDESGRALPASKAVTGMRTFAHVLPTHVEAMRRHPRAIQPDQPELVGNAANIGETTHAASSPRSDKIGD
jgi:isopropylmalate/homocitrate/citramalate synthase